MRCLIHRHSFQIAAYGALSRFGYLASTVLRKIAPVRSSQACDPMRTRRTFSTIADALGERRRVDLQREIQRLRDDLAWRRAAAAEKRRAWNYPDVEGDEGDYR